MTMLRRLWRLVAALGALAYAWIALFAAGVRESLRREPGNINSGADRP